MIDYATAKRVCETYTRSLEASDLETLLDLFADDASIEDPVGTPLREGKEVLRAFYAEACQGVAKAELTGSPRLAGNEVAFPFTVTAGTPEQEIIINIIDVFRFNDAGKVATMRAFWGPDNMNS
ncbi:MAG: Steroid Delta-isomerase [Halieaceae bacterium]|nr:MAG: Steroid Delta-isomerase [Halieaceae bacterium]|tara:strand:+ start:3907 stop:4278 length:372 start_codon:yes stop_codon:yes gene_type:complete